MSLLTLYRLVLSEALKNMYSNGNYSKQSVMYMILSESTKKELSQRAIAKL